MKLFWFLLSLPLAAQQGQSGLVHWERLTNPPINVFLLKTPTIAELGRPICIDHITVTALLLDGGRDSEGDERRAVKTYQLTLIEQHNGLTRPRSVDLGSGHLLKIVKVESFPATDEICKGLMTGVVW